jgi:hypothetical protein
VTSVEWKKQLGVRNEELGVGKASDKCGVMRVKWEIITANCHWYLLLIRGFRWMNGNLAGKIQ